MKWHLMFVSEPVDIPVEHRYVNDLGASAEGLAMYPGCIDVLRRAKPRGQVVVKGVLLIGGRGFGV